jgi:hypothetical protein
VINLLRETVTRGPSRLWFGLLRTGVVHTLRPGLVSMQGARQPRSFFAARYNLQTIMLTTELGDTSTCTSLMLGYLPFSQSDTGAYSAQIVRYPRVAAAKLPGAQAVIAIIHQFCIARFGARSATLQGDRGRLEVDSCCRYTLKLHEASELNIVANH